MLNKIESMAQLFHQARNKNMVLLIDSLEDEQLEQKKYIGSEFFEHLPQEDRVSLISVSRKVNIIYSLTEKSKNTVQLHNQLKHLRPSSGRRLYILKGLKEAVKEIINYGHQRSEHNFNWIVFIGSTFDLSSFRNTDLINKIKYKLLSHKISLIFISGGIKSENKLRKLQKEVNFNDSVIFMHEPTSKQIYNLVQNISNVNIEQDNLIYEKF